MNSSEIVDHSDEGSTNHPPSTGLLGIHHITAIAGAPQQNVEFYVGILRLRLVKQTVNYDDPGTYHVYFGDELVRPGTILTFFPRPGAPAGATGWARRPSSHFLSLPNHSDFGRIVSGATR